MDGEEILNHEWMAEESVDFGWLSRLSHAKTCIIDNLIDKELFLAFTSLRYLNKVMYDRLPYLISLWSLFQGGINV